MNRLGDLSRVTEEVLRFLEENGIGGQAAYVTNLAIEELGTNILKYGYDDRGAHEILLRVEIEGESVRVVLEDDGHEFNPLRLPAPDVNIAAEERVPGGLGIHLVRSLAEGMEYERANGRNRVVVRVRV